MDDGTSIGEIIRLLIVMEQVLVWILDNFLGALLSACFGAMLGICGSSYYFKNKSSVRQTQKSGDNSQNIQVNGDFEDNKINK